MSATPHVGSPHPSGNPADIITAPPFSFLAGVGGVGAGQQGTGGGSFGPDGAAGGVMSAAQHAATQHPSGNLADMITAPPGECDDSIFVYAITTDLRCYALVEYTFVKCLLIHVS